MLPYFILFGMFAVPAILKSGRPFTINQRGYWLASLILIVAIGLRREVGADWWNYLDMFREIARMDYGRAIQRTEIGYATLNWIGAQAGLSVWFPNVICAGIFTFGLMSLCRLQPNVYLAIVVAMYTVLLVGMGYTRQSAALGFVMVAIAQYSQGRTLRVALFLGLAALFHASAIGAAVVIAIALARRGIVTFALVVILGIFLFFQLSEQSLGRFQEYAGQAYTAVGAIPRILMNLVPAVLYMAFRGRFGATISERRLWMLFSLSSFGSILLLFIFPSSLIADRFALYLTPLQIFILSRLPTVFGNLRRNSQLVVLAVVAYSLVIQTVWLTQGVRSLAWLPYRNYVWDWAPPRPRPARKEAREL